LSIFDSVIQEHDKKKAEMEARIADAQALKQAAQNDFVEKFNATVSSVVEPIFAEFVADAKKYGFPAEVEEIRGREETIYVSLRLIPEKGAVFGTNRSAQVVFSINGMITSQKVEYVSYYDQRPGKHGTDRTDFGLPSLNKDVIERELAKFLKMAIHARSVPEQY
jgi:hypothetical protein